MPPEIEDMLVRLMSGCTRVHGNNVGRLSYALKVRSKKSTNARALAVAARPVGSPAHRSRAGRLHSDTTPRTAPEHRSRLNIHSPPISNPTPPTPPSPHP